MCRFVLYLGPPLTLASLVTEPAHSLINQSTHAKERDEPLNGDGFGVAWYMPEVADEPGLFRSVTPAWNNINLHRLAKVTRSGCILAHVRAATQSLAVSEANCHPFVDGSFAFMHNGDLGGFSRVRRALAASLSDEAYALVRGSTDSEHLFAMTVDRLGPQVHSSEAMAGALFRAVEDALAIAREAGVEEHSYLNIAMSDGRSAVACRVTTDVPEHADSLYVHTGRGYICERGVCRMIDAADGQGAVVISSEPLSSDDGWTPVPVNHLVRVDSDRRVHFEAWPGRV